MSLTAAFYLGSILLAGGAVALLEHRLLGAYGLWILPVLGIAASYLGFRFTSGPCGNPEGFFVMFLLLVLGGYGLGCVLQQARNLLRSAA